MPKRVIFEEGDDRKSSAKKSRSTTVAKRRPSRASSSTAIHKFVRTCSTNTSNAYGIDLYNGFTINGTNTGLFTMTISWTLGGMALNVGGARQMDLPNSSELTALYDQYKIDWVEVDFIFSNNQSSVNSPGTNMPIMWVCKDYDDSNAASVTDIQQYESAKCWQMGEVGKTHFKMRVRPKLASSVYNTGVSGTYSPQSGFIDTAYTNVPHFGIKLAYDPIKTPASATLVGYLSINAKYHLTMKHTK